MWASVDEAWTNFSNPYTEHFDNFDEHSINEGFNSLVTTKKPTPDPEAETTPDPEAEAETTPEPESAKVTVNKPQFESNNVPQTTTNDILKAMETNNSSINAILTNMNNKIDRKLADMNNKINENIKQYTPNNANFFNENVHDILLFIIFGVFVILLLDSTYRLFMMQLKKK